MSDNMFCVRLILYNKSRFIFHIVKFVSTVKKIFSSVVMYPFNLVNKESILCEDLQLLIFKFKGDPIIEKTQKLKRELVDILALKKKAISAIRIFSDIRVVHNTNRPPLLQKAWKEIFVLSYHSIDTDCEECY